MDAATLQADRKALDLEREMFTKEKLAHNLETTLTNAVTQHKGDPKILLPNLRENIGFDEDGQMIVKGNDGKPLMSEAGDMMTPDQYVAEMAGDKAMGNYFASAQKGGGGAPSDRNASVINHSRGPHSGKVGVQEGESKRQYIDRRRAEGASGYGRN